MTPLLWMTGVVGAQVLYLVSLALRSPILTVIASFGNAICLGGLLISLSH